jgi:hypothetical protein
MRKKMRSFLVSLAAAALVVVIAALPAPAATTTLYAYDDAVAGASSPASCPLSPDTTLECNLQQVVALANASSTASSPYVIDLESTSKNPTFSGPLQITAAGVSIDGGGESVTASSGGTVISVTASGGLTLGDLMVSGGTGPSGSSGDGGAGGISNAGTLTLNDVVVSNNTGGSAGCLASCAGGPGRHRQQRHLADQWFDHHEQHGRTGNRD